MAKKRKTRRANGEGTVYQRKDTGKWTAEVTMGYDQHGRRVSRRKSGFATAADARAYIPTLRSLPDPEQEERSAKVKARQMATVRDVFYDAIRRRGRKVEDKTVQTYMSLYKANISKIGHIPFEVMEPMDWQKILDNMEKSGKAHSTRRSVLAVIRMICNHGVLIGLTDTDRSAALESGVSNRKLYHVALEDWEIERVLAAAKFGDEIAMMSAILCFTGFRISEFLGLTHDKYSAQNRYFVGGSKTPNGKNRIVPIPLIVEPYVRYFAEKSKGEYIFTLGDSPKRARPETVRQGIHKMCERIQIKDHLPHDFRRTMATLMKNIKAADADKQAIIGHANAEMTMYYQDSRASELLEIADKLWVAEK